jgi:hypothetical protein
MLEGGRYLEGPQNIYELLRGGWQKSQKGGLPKIIIKHHQFTVIKTSQYHILHFIGNWTSTCRCVGFSGVASPTIWSCYANFKSLS